jgi:hypothetical protein
MESPTTTSPRIGLGRRGRLSQMRRQTLASTNSCRRWSLNSLSAVLLDQRSLRLFFDPLQRICLFLKSENRVRFPAVLHDAD